MEPQQTNFELELDDVSVVSMTQAAKWAKIIAIIFAVCCALGVLFGLFASTMIGTFMAQYEQYSGAYGSIFGVLSRFLIIIILIVVAIVGVFVYLLLSFANNTSRAMLTKDPVSLEKGTGALKNYFLLGGVFAILGILFTLINLFS